MIKVCDAIMGSGKSSAAASYMNAYPEKKFIYITPYLKQANEITDRCKGRDFVQPIDTDGKFDYSKLKHTRSLIAQGKNIITTHAAFRSYTDEMLEQIQDYHYELIVDEAVDVFVEADGFNEGDVEALREGNYIEEDGDLYAYTGKEYRGKCMSDLFDMIKCNNLVTVKRSERGEELCYYWALPRKLLDAFENVIVLTYLFETSDMWAYFKMNDIEYVNIGVRKYENGVYSFNSEPDYIPEYVKNLNSLITVFENRKMNAIGNRANALSSNWLKDKKHEHERDILRKNQYNFIRNYCKAKGDRVMWSTYCKVEHKLKGRGYADQFVVFNQKSSNNYRSCDVLSYLVNVYEQPEKVRFYSQNGLEYNSDGHALSVMLQWIWRSAIRDQKPITIYIPSRRMRTLLKDWIEEVSAMSQKDLHAGD